MAVYTFSTPRDTPVDAPVDEVFRILTVPGEFDQWWGARLVSADHRDKAQTGDDVHGEMRELGRTWSVTIHFEHVDHENHVVHFRGRFLLGITSTHRVTCTALSDGRTLIEDSGHLELQRNVIGFVLKRRIAKKVRTTTVPDWMKHVKALAEKRHRERLVAA